MIVAKLVWEGCGGRLGWWLTYPPTKELKLGRIAVMGPAIRDVVRAYEKAIRENPDIAISNIDVAGINNHQMRSQVAILNSKYGTKFVVPAC